MPAKQRQTWAYVGMILLAVFAAWLAGPAMLALEGPIYGLVTGMIVAGGGYLLNKELAPQSPKTRANTSRAYSWNPQTMQQTGVPIPKLYGRNRVHGNVIGCYTEEENTIFYLAPWLVAWYVAHDLPVPEDEGAIAISEQTLNLLIDLGEGPISGLVADSIQINGQPIGSFEDVTYEFRYGRLEQTACSKFATLPLEYPIRTPILNSEGPVTYTTPDSDFDDLEVVFECPAGLWDRHQDGGTDAYSVGVKIEISKHDENDWTVLFNSGICGAVFHPVRRTFRVSTTYWTGSPVTVERGTRYDIRATKTTGDYAVGEESTRHGAALSLYAVREIINVGFTYPGRALLQISALATEKLSGSLDVSIEVDGSVVNTYDAETETWSLAQSSNPAWVIFDMLTMPVISGDGGAAPYAIAEYRGPVAAADIDLATFATLAAYADALVPDGAGGTETRLAFDGFFEVDETVGDVVQTVCAVSRCGLQWKGNQPFLYIETSRSPVGVLSDGNCIAGSIHETLIPTTERAAEIEIHYRDENADYARTPLLVRNPAIPGTHKATLQLNGVTTQSRAVRLMNYELKRNQYIDRSERARQGIDALLWELGDVVYAQRPGRSWGGRLQAVHGRRVRIDRDVRRSAHDRLIVMTYDGGTSAYVIESHAVKTVDYRQIQIDGDWTVTPSRDDVYLFGPDSISGDQYEITGLNRGSNVEFGVTLMKYDGRLYTADDTAPTVIVDIASAPAQARRTSLISPPTMEDVRRQSPAAIALTPASSMVPVVEGVAFSGDGVDTVTWTGGSAWYQGVMYPIAANATGTTERYIYFDSDADDPTALQSSDVYPTTANQWVLAENNAGVVKYIYGVGTVDAATTALLRDGTRTLTAPWWTGHQEIHASRLILGSSSSSSSSSSSLSSSSSSSSSSAGA